MEINKIQFEQFNENIKSENFIGKDISTDAKDQNYLNNLPQKLSQFLSLQTDDEMEIENFDLSDLDNLNLKNAENNELINLNQGDIQKLNGNMFQYINQNNEALANELTEMENNVQNMLEQMQEIDIATAKKQPDAFKELRQQAMKMLEDLQKLRREFIRGTKDESDFETKYNNLVQNLIKIINYTGTEVDGDWIRVSNFSDNDNLLSADIIENLSTLNNANDRDNIIAELQKIIKP